jgi:hypothetical protein
LLNACSYIPKALEEDHRLEQARRQTIEIDEDMTAASNGLSPELTLKKIAEDAHFLINTGSLPSAGHEAGLGGPGPSAHQCQVSSSKKTGGIGEQACMEAHHEHHVETVSSPIKLSWSPF